MKDFARVHITGTVTKDLEIQHNLKGKKVGVATITVNKKIGYDSLDGDYLFEPKWFRAFISDESSLDYFKSIITKDRRINIMGKLDIIQANMGDPNSQYIINLDQPLE